MTLTMPTRELVGLLADVYPFATPDDEDTLWHRVVIRWDGDRLHALAGGGNRLAWMSWGPDDGDAPGLPLGVSAAPSDPWELAILPENAKEIATKFKLGVKEGDAPLTVTGDGDTLRVERDADFGGGVSLRSADLARPWDTAAPRIEELIGDVAADIDGRAFLQPKVAYSGVALADFCNPKVVRQRGPVVLTFGRTSTYVKIGRWFQGAITQAEVPRDR